MVKSKASASSEGKAAASANEGVAGRETSAADSVTADSLVLEELMPSAKLAAGQLRGATRSDRDEAVATAYLELQGRRGSRLELEAEFARLVRAAYRGQRRADRGRRELPIGSIDALVAETAEPPPSRYRPTADEAKKVSETLNVFASGPVASALRSFWLWKESPSSQTPRADRRKLHTRRLHDPLGAVEHERMLYLDGIRRIADHVGTIKASRDWPETAEEARFVLDGSSRRLGDIIDDVVLFRRTLVPSTAPVSRQAATLVSRLLWACGVHWAGEDDRSVMQVARRRHVDREGAAVYAVLAGASDTDHSRHPAFRQRWGRRSRRLKGAGPTAK